MKQDDVKKLYVETIISYSHEKKIYLSETTKLFKKNFVFEEIILNYEWLKILDIADSVNLADEVISNDNQLIVYHGTNVSFDKIDLKKSKPYRDFGNGFYCTILEKQAKNWAKRLSIKRGKSLVYEYKFKNNSDLKIKKFITLDKNWLNFIIKNRNVDGKKHDYDVVIGPIADDNVRETIDLFELGKYNYEETIEKLKYHDLTYQISFHTKKALRNLELIKISEV